MDRRFEARKRELLERMFPDRIGLNIGGLRGWSVLGPLL